MATAMVSFLRETDTLAVAGWCWKKPPYFGSVRSSITLDVVHAALPLRWRVPLVDRRPAASSLPRHTNTMSRSSVGPALQLLLQLVEVGGRQRDG